jgi:hypothetical protein
MLRLAGEQVESLLDELLPVEVRELPAELAALDRLLADPRLLAPIEQAWEQTARDHGRPTIPMGSFVRCPGSSADVVSGTGSYVGSRASRIIPGHHLHPRA